MKKIVLLLTVLAVLAGCFTDWRGEGAIIINLGSEGENGRNGMKWPPDKNNILDFIKYDIKIEGKNYNHDEKNIPANKGTITHSGVPAGKYTVTVKATLTGYKTPLSPDLQKIPYATGTETVEVKAGKTEKANITMTGVGFCKDCKWVVTTQPGFITDGVETQTCDYNHSHNRTQPVRAAGVKTISAASTHSIAVKTNGELWAWGGNGNGNLGDGTTTNRLSPVRIGNATDWEAVSAGSVYSLALKTNGELWAWGRNERGQIGDGTIDQRTSPVQIGTETNWASVSGGTYHSLALKKDGSLWAWGENTNGQLGDGTTNDSYSPVRIGSDTDWESVSGGQTNTLALKENGSLWAWGANTSGQLGDGTSGTANNKTTPLRIGSDTDWTSVSVGTSHTLALKENGSLWAWGANTSGQLGDGTSGSVNNKASPVQIGTGWASVTAGNTHTLAIKTDGSLLAWGGNNFGCLGDGTTTNRASPVRIGTDTDWASVHCAGGLTIALKTNGELWAWGRNESGQIGDGTTSDRYSPVRVGGNCTVNSEQMSSVCETKLSDTNTAH
ncbi:MAG: hypothetical protein LBH44_00480 [Treponema sp.]|jgi:alpha-tubulin suppressor-like RCC1 family protein|nr:hypothetical protein [Treponema sp.]